MKTFQVALLYFSIITGLNAQSGPEVSESLRVGIAGLTHTHVHWILGREDIGDIEIVGIAEPNKELAQRYAEQHGFSMDLVYSSLDEMLSETKPEAVTAFGTIYQHLEVVESCAPKGIHVMVEKPLAISVEHALKMEKLAKEHRIHLLTNYETTWYPTTNYTLSQVTAEKLGKINRVVVNDGHQGPVEIGINKEFLDWLTDPEQNGAGALTDFGCYGANIITNIMNNQLPLSVTAVTSTNKPDLYPEVDDEATIILQYPKTVGVIQPSWNWTFSRKDMEVYGTQGYIKTKNADDLVIRLAENKPDSLLRLPPLDYPASDPFAYLAAVANGKLDPNGDLNSLENNLIVVRILDAAKKSAASGKTVVLK